MIGVAHHSNEQVDEDDDGDKQVDGKDDLEDDERPLGVDVALGLLQVLGLVQPKQGKEEKLKGGDGRQNLICNEQESKFL